MYYMNLLNRNEILSIKQHIFKKKTRSFVFIRENHDCVDMMDDWHVLF